MKIARKFASLKIACLAASLALCVAALPAAATYGPRVSIGGVYQQTSSTRSHDGITPGSCDSVVFCYILFQPVLGQRPVIIEHVSCWVFTGVEANLAKVALTSRRDNDIQFRESWLIPYNANGFSFLVSGAVLHPLDSTDRAMIYLVFDKATNYAAECTISGHVVTP